MEVSFQFKKLNYRELRVVLNNLRLGADYLKKHLSNKQFSNLLSLGGLSKEQHRNVHSNIVEKSGNVILILNTIVTSIFGAWLGFVGFMELSLSSIPALLTITAAAALASGYFGYNSFKLNNAKVKNAIINLKLHNAELKLLKIIEQKQRQHVEEFFHYLELALKKQANGVEILPKSYEINDGITDEGAKIFCWFKSLIEILANKIASLKKKDIYKIYIKEICKNRQEIENIILHYLASAGMDRYFEQAYGSTAKLSDDNEELVKLLSKQSLINAKVSSGYRQQISRTNFKEILTGLAPTIMGGFASMFVFLAGAPNVVKELGIYELYIILEQPGIKWVEFAIAVALTIYFGFSYVYSYLNSFKRKHEIKLAQEAIGRQEILQKKINAKIYMFKKIKKRIHKINYLFLLISKISFFIKNK